jgi:hypothetical protein
VNTRPSERSSNEWIDTAARTGELTDALLAVAAAQREQVSYCPVPPGYRAVFDCGDGSLVVEPIVAIQTNNEHCHRAVTLNGPEGFSDDCDPIWYLAPGENLVDLEHLVRDAIKKHDEMKARLAAIKAQT